ncbi:MAG: hypothetical protein ACLUJG_00235 [Lawsonibacter sp.]
MAVQHLGALVLEAVFQDDLVCGAAAQDGGGLSLGVLGAAQHGRDPDAAAHQQIMALRLHGKAVARQAQHIQAVAHGAAGQPVGALTPDLKYDSQKVAGLI